MMFYSLLQELQSTPLFLQWGEGVGGGITFPFSTGAKS